MAHEALHLHFRPPMIDRGVIRRVNLETAFLLACKGIRRDW